MPLPPRISIAELLFHCSCNLPALARENARRGLKRLPPLCPRRTALGFTLAELLISLAILGVMAAIAIPALLTAQTNGQYNSVVKEAASSVAGIFSQQQALGQITTNTNANALISQMNYIKVDSGSVATIDDVQGGGTMPCIPANPCYYFPSGAAIRPGYASFSGANTTNAIMFFVDPDGIANGTTKAKSVKFFILYNGLLTTVGTAPAGTYYNSITITAAPAADSPWFSW